MKEKEQQQQAKTLSPHRSLLFLEFTGAMNFGLSFAEVWWKTHLNIVSVRRKSNFPGSFFSYSLHFYAQFIV